MCDTLHFAGGGRKKDFAGRLQCFHLDVVLSMSETQIRGEFESIRTTVPGIRVCEYLPRLAKLADQLEAKR